MIIFGGTNYIQKPLYDYYILDLDVSTGVVKTIEKKELKIEEKDVFIMPMYNSVVYQKEYKDVITIDYDTQCIYSFKDQKWAKIDNNMNN